MNREVIVLSEANDDLIEQALYIGADNMDFADRFLDAAEEAFEQLSRMPGMGVARPMSHPELRGIRLWPISGFRRHLIFYRLEKDAVEIVRVLYASRDIVAIFGDKVGE